MSPNQATSLSYLERFQPLLPLEGRNRHPLFLDSKIASSAPIHMKPATLLSKAPPEQQKIMDCLSGAMDPARGVIYTVGVCGARGAESGIQVTSGLPFDLLFMLISLREAQDISEHAGNRKPVLCLLGDEIANGNPNVKQSVEAQAHIEVAAEFFRHAISGIVDILGITHHTVVSGKDYRDSAIYQSALRAAKDMSATDLHIPDSSGEVHVDYYRHQVAAVHHFRDQYNVNAKLSWHRKGWAETGFDVAQHQFNRSMQMRDQNLSGQYSERTGNSDMYFFATLPGYNWDASGPNRSPQVPPYYIMKGQKRFDLLSEQGAVDYFVLEVQRTGGCHTNEKSPQDYGLPVHGAMKSGLQYLENGLHHLEKIAPGLVGSEVSKQEIVGKTLDRHGLGPEYARAVAACARLDGLKIGLEPVLRAATAAVGGPEKLNQSLGFSPPLGLMPEDAPASEPSRGALDPRTANPNPLPFVLG